MERVQEAPPPSASEELASLPPMPLVEPGTIPLLARLEDLRGPGVTAGEVDAFLAGLSAPRPPDEPPRLRADLLLDVLEDPRVAEFTGSDGRRVGAVALEALLGLGYPYALEVTPDMLARVRDAEPRHLSRGTRWALGLAGGGNLLLHTGIYLYRYIDTLPPDARTWFIEERFLDKMEPLALSAGAILLAPVLAALGDLSGWKWLNRLGRKAQWLVTLVFGLLSWGMLEAQSMPYGVALGVSAALGLATALALSRDEDAP